MKGTTMGQKMGKSWKIIDVFSVASTPKNCAKSRHGQTTGGEEKFPFFFLPLGSANGGSLVGCWRAADAKAAAKLWRWWWHNLLGYTDAHWVNCDFAFLDPSLIVGHIYDVKIWRMVSNFDVWRQNDLKMAISSPNWAILMVFMALKAI